MYLDDDISARLIRIVGIKQLKRVEMNILF